MSRSGSPSGTFVLDRRAPKAAASPPAASRSLPHLPSFHGVPQNGSQWEVVECRLRNDAGRFVLRPLLELSAVLLLPPESKCSWSPRSPQDLSPGPSWAAQSRKSACLWRPPRLACFPRIPMLLCCSVLWLLLHPHLCLLPVLGELLGGRTRAASLTPLQEERPLQRSPFARWPFSWEGVSLSY